MSSTSSSDHAIEKDCDSFEPEYDPFEPECDPFVPSERDEDEDEDEQFHTPLTEPGSEHGSEPDSEPDTEPDTEPDDLEPDEPEPDREPPPIEPVIENRPAELLPPPALVYFTIDLALQVVKDWARAHHYGIVEARSKKYKKNGSQYQFYMQCDHGGQY